MTFWSLSWRSRKTFEFGSRELTIPKRSQSQNCQVCIFFCLPVSCTPTHSSQFGSTGGSPDGNPPGNTPEKMAGFWRRHSGRKKWQKTQEEEGTRERGTWEVIRPSFVRDSFACFFLNRSKNIGNIIIINWLYYYKFFLSRNDQGSHITSLLTIWFMLVCDFGAREMFTGNTSRSGSTCTVSNAILPQDLRFHRSCVGWSRTSHIK